MDVVGLTGLKRSGKSTAANALVEFEYDNHGTAKRLSLAQPIKQACQQIFGLSYDQVYGDLKEDVDPRWNLTPRVIMQKFGTEVGRSIHTETWIKNLDERLEGYRRRGCTMVVIDDVRFPNELDYLLKKWGAITVRVESDDTQPDGHASEGAIAFLPVDFTVQNDKSVDKRLFEFKIVSVVHDELKRRGIR